MSKLAPLVAHFSLQRVLAGLLFLPLMAYCFDPFRGLDLSFTARLVFWTGVIALALFGTWCSGTLVQKKIKQSPALLRDAAFAGVVLCLFAPACWLLTVLVFSFSGQESPGLGMVVPFGLTLTAGLMLVRPGEGVAQEQEQPTPPRLYRRLPCDFKGEVYRLSGRNHNVDVGTSDGVFTIRSRLIDAIEEMDPVSGHCTHRSHWVTDDAIIGVEKQGSKTFLKLRNDDLVPVSRKYRPELEEAGLV